MKQLLLKNRKRFIYYILGALLASSNTILSSLALTVGFTMLDAKTNQEFIMKAVVVVLFGFAPILLQLLSRYMRIGFMRDVLIDVRTLTYKRIMNIPIEEFRNKKREDYMAMLAADINIFERDFFWSVLNIIYSLGSFVVGEIILCMVHPLIALMVFIASVILLGIVRLFETPIRKARRENQEANAEYTSKSANLLNGLEVLKLYQVEENFKPPFYFIVERLERIKRKANLMNQVQWNLSMWVAQVSQFAMYLVATYLFIEGKIEKSGLTLIFNFVGSLVWGSINGFNFMNRLKSSIDIFNRITEGATFDLGGSPFSLENHIVVKDLHYAYGDNTVINGLNLEIKKGDKVLVYGPSGTGKTTFANCISQNLSDYEGQILVDDVELKTISKTSFLESCGYIRQHHFMFEDSIRHNIVLNQPLDLVKLEKLLKDLDLWEWVSGLPEGWDTVLENNGTNISGGQRQRLSIAREIYRGCEVLFIDEPSASLDDETALHVYETLMRLDQTMVIISHRHLDYLKKIVTATVIFGDKGGYIYETH